VKRLYVTIPLFFLLIVIANSIFIISERQQAIVIQFGKPVGEPVVDAGINFKIPLIQNVIRFDKRVLDWDADAVEMPTKDNKYIHIDAFARWKISDPLKFYKSAKNEMLAQSRLDDIIDGAIRDEISIRVMEEIIRSTSRNMELYAAETMDKTMDDQAEKNIKAIPGARLSIIKNIQMKVSSKLEELDIGIEIVDIQLKRINYNDEVQPNIFNRMISDQERIAEKYRAQGQAKKQEIIGLKVQKKKEILSQAYLESQEIRGRADAKTTKIYADAYNKSPDFYNFYKTHESYDSTIDSTTRFILSTDSKYLRYLDLK